MNIIIEEELTEEKLGQIESLFLALGGFSRQVVEHSLSGRPGLVCIYGLIDDEVVGCKLGFSPRPGYFESWMGGVSNKHQGNGIATQLQEAQHNWCTEYGYKYIQTSTGNDNLPMQLINLKSGFKVVGTEIHRGTQFKVLYEKELK